LATKKKSKKAKIIKQLPIFKPLQKLSSLINIYLPLTAKLKIKHDKHWIFLGYWAMIFIFLFLFLWGYPDPITYDHELVKLTWIDLIFLKCFFN
jgi:hypothetical protein